MLARTPAALKKRRYRRRRRDGVCVLYIEVKEAEFAEALLTAGYLTERQALRRDQLTREAKDILEQFTDRWRHQHPKRDAELRMENRTGDEKRAAIIGGSKCETGRCPGRWLDAPVNDRETLTRS